MYFTSVSTKVSAQLSLGFVLLQLAACSESPSSSVEQAAQVIEPSGALSAGAIHQRSIVIDAHADIVIPSTSTSYLSGDGTSKVSPDKLLEGGMDAVVMSVAVGPGPRTDESDAAARMEADEKIAAIHTLIAQNTNQLTLVTTAQEIRAAEKNGKSAIILGFQNARSLQKNVAAIDHFYGEGVRIFGLNHLAHNDFSDSSRPLFNGETGSYEVTEEHGGLSPLGVEAIKRINELGALVDISQLSDAAATQVLNMTTAPIIASHSNARAISDVQRNLKDELIDAVGDNGGVIHVAAFKGYLLDISAPDFVRSLKSLRAAAGIAEEYDYPYELYWEIEDLEKRAAYISAVTELLGPATVENMVNHVDYIVNRIGIDHVGIGNDFNHGSGIDDYVDASDALNVTQALLNRGYSSSDIQKIWGGNFLRVLEEAEQNRTLN